MAGAQVKTVNNKRNRFFIPDPVMTDPGFPISSAITKIIKNIVVILTDRLAKTVIF
jgi:hypothetical protein